MYMNQLTIIGFTGQDAEFHSTPNRTPVATISVATKESWKNDQGEWQSRTEWHRVVAFGKLGDYAKTLVKGAVRRNLRVGRFCWDISGSTCRVRTLVDGYQESRLDTFGKMGFRAVEWL